jgi:hypothetical protein
MGGIAECPNWPACGHTRQGDCDADAQGVRPLPPVLSAAGCGTCNGTCPAPEACHQPGPTPAPSPFRVRMFKPSYELDGPHRRKPGRILRALRALFPFLNH